MSVLSGATERIGADTRHRFGSSGTRTMRTPSLRKAPATAAAMKAGLIGEGRGGSNPFGPRRKKGAGFAAYALDLSAISAGSLPAPVTAVALMVMAPAPAFAVAFVMAAPAPAVMPRTGVGGASGGAKHAGGESDGDDDLLHG